MGDREDSPMLRCASCGTFVLATIVEDEKVPTLEACLDCGDSDFIDPFGD